MQIDSFPPHPWIAFARATAMTTSFSFIRWKSHFNSKKLPATSDVSSRWMHYWQKVAPLLNTPFSMFVAAFLMLDARCSMLDARCLMLDAWYSIGRVEKSLVQFMLHLNLMHFCFVIVLPGQLFHANWWWSYLAYQNMIAASRKEDTGAKCNM